jgi:8-amino-7-oxononanoate synthase
MLDINRKVPRYEISFEIVSNVIIGTGINISQKGLAFLTSEEMVPAYDIPFKINLQNYIYSQKNYQIQGTGNLLYSKKDPRHQAYYINGFEFTRLNRESRDILLNLENDIRNYEKNVVNGITMQSLTDFHYFPSENLNDKSDLFYNTIFKEITRQFDMLSYHSKNGSRPTAAYHHQWNQTDRDMINLGSNNYLGLTTHPEVVDAAKKALDQFGTGNGAGSMVGGTFTIHRELEEELADFTGKESAILFNSGYNANIGIISGLLRPGDVVINDQFNHASILDGCEMTKAKRLLFTHSNPESLKRIMERVKLKYCGKLIIINGVFSSSGEIPDLPAIIRLARDYNFMVMVDEAHGLGVLGKTGIGASEHWNMTDQVDIIMGTLSKSLGGIGGFAASRKSTIEYLRYYSHSYLFSTGIPPASAASVLAALRILRKNPSLLDQLRENITYFKSLFKSEGIQISNSQAAIIALPIPDTEKLFRFSKKLFDLGVYHNLFTYPAVPQGGSLIRFGLMATHTRKELKKAFESILESLKAADISDKKDERHD